MVERDVVGVFFDTIPFLFPLEVAAMKPSRMTMLPRINASFQRLFPPQVSPGHVGGNPAASLSLSNHP